MSDHLFVYGSLRSDIDTRRLPSDASVGTTWLHARATLVDRATARGRLHAVNWYPAFTPGSSDSIVGQVWRLNDPGALLPELDAYEGDEYHRERLEVRLDSGSVMSAWVYVYDASLRHAPRIDSGDYAHWIAQQTP